MTQTRLAASSRVVSEEAIPISTILVVLTTCLVLAGPDTENAQQAFSNPLTAAIDTIEQGSVLRPAATFLLAGWAILTLIRLSPKPRLQIRPLVAIPLIAFLSVAAASFVWAIDPQLTFRRVALASLLGLASFALARKYEQAQLARITLTVSLAIVLLAVVTQVGFGSFEPFSGEWRLAGLFHPVALSWYCCLGTLAAFYIAMQSTRRRVVYIGFASFLVGVLVLTRTRTGIAALVLGLFVLVFVHWVDSRRRLLATALVGMGLTLFAVTVAGAIGLSWSGVYSNVVEVTSLGRPDAVSQIATFTGRIPVWETSLVLIEQRPLLGYGYNSFSSAELLGLFSAASGWVPTSSHSGFIDALLSLGVVGASLFTVLIAAALWTSYRTAHQRASFAFAAALITWLAANLLVESSVLFEASFVPLLVFAILFQIAFFAPDRPERL